MQAAQTESSTSARGGSDILVRTVRHEVGDLLQTVYATAAILQKRLGPERELEQRVLADMRARAEACRQFLDVAHDLACDFALEVGPLDFGELVRAASHHFQQKHGECQVSVECDKEVVMQGDGRRLEQMVNQVLAHAGEVATVIRCKLERSADCKSIEWTVCDNGPSLSDDQKNKIFAHCYTTRYGRPGIGMALSRKLAELHGGVIAADNIPGGGLCVRVCLPADATS